MNVFQLVKKRALCSQLMHMAVFSSQCRRVSCSPLEVQISTLQWAAVSQAHFFAHTLAGHMRAAANRAISTVASYPIPFVVIVTLSFPLNR